MIKVYEMTDEFLEDLMQTAFERGMKEGAHRQKIYDQMDSQRKAQSWLSSSWMHTKKAENAVLQMVSEVKEGVLPHHQILSNWDKNRP